MVLEWGTMDFGSAQMAKKSPLAEKLFSIEGVDRVFYGRGFISVCIKDETKWPNI